MSTPFLNHKIQEGILNYWKSNILKINYEGEEFILGLVKNKIMIFLGYKKIFSIYDSFFVLPEIKDDLEEELNKALIFIQNNIIKRYKADEISVKLSSKGESLLAPELSYWILKRFKRKLPLGFYYEVVEYNGLVDLKIPFNNYLASLKSGHREFFLRGKKRDLYNVNIVSSDITLDKFNNFVFRWRETYCNRGYRFKYEEDMLSILFNALIENRAWLVSIDAKNDKNIYADILILHDDKDAYYYAGTRKSGVGVLSGVAFFAQIVAIKYMQELGFNSYSLGFIGADFNKEKKIKRGVDVFKASLSNVCVPLVHIRKEKLFLTFLKYLEKLGVERFLLIIINKLRIRRIFNKKK